MLGGCCGQAPIAREQRGIKRLGEGDVNGIVSREVVSQTPDPLKQRIVGMPAQRKLGQVGESRSTKVRIEFPMPRISPHRLCDFDVKQMRRVQRQSESNSRLSIIAAARMCRTTSTKTDASTTITGGRVRHESGQRAEQMA